MIEGRDPAEHHPPGEKSSIWGQASTARWLLAPVALFVFSRIAIFAIAGWSLWIEPHVRENPPLHPWGAVDGLNRWDARWFGEIADRGYVNVQDPNFFPLFPLLGRWLHQGTGLSLPMSFLIVSNAFALGGIVAVHAVFRSLEGDAAATTATGLLVAWPFSFFQAAAYPESIMLATTALGLYLAMRGRHLTGGAALAVGVFARHLTLVAWLSLLAAQVRERGWRPRRLVLNRSFIGLLLPPAALLLYMAFLTWQFHDPFAWFRARFYWGEAAWWGLGTMIRRPGHVLAHEQGPPIVLYLTMSVIPMAGALMLLSRRRWWVLAPFGLGLMLLLYASGLAGLGRYTASCWPAFLPLGLALNRYPALKLPVVVACAMFQGMLVYLLVHGYPIT